MSSTIIEARKRYNAQVAAGNRGTRTNFKRREPSRIQLLVAVICTSVAGMFSTRSR